MTSTFRPAPIPSRFRWPSRGRRKCASILKSGDLVVTLPDGSELRQLKPKVYQQVGEKRAEIAGGYRLLAQQRAAFTLAGV